MTESKETYHGHDSVTISINPEPFSPPTKDSIMQKFHRFIFSKTDSIKPTNKVEGTITIGPNFARMKLENLDIDTDAKKQSEYTILGRPNPNKDGSSKSNYIKLISPPAVTEPPTPTTAPDQNLEKPEPPASTTAPDPEIEKKAPNESNTQKQSKEDTSQIYKEFVEACRDDLREYFNQMKNCLQLSLAVAKSYYEVCEKNQISIDDESKQKISSLISELEKTIKNEK